MGFSFNICNTVISKFKRIKKFCCRKKDVNIQINCNNNTLINTKTENDVILPQYINIKTLGTGGSSIVYKAQNMISKKNYICKRVSKTSSALREINILKKLPTSRFFPKYKDNILDNNRISIITEYIEGVELFAWFKTNYCDNKRRLPYIILKQFLIEMLTAINILNNHNLCHLDIKFENIILQKPDTNRPLDFKLVLIDYEMAHLYTDKLEKLSCACGTVGYTPLEIYQGYYHKNSDIWSVGICLWIMLTSELPFSHSKKIYKDGENYNIDIFIFPNEYHKRCKKKHNISDYYFDMVRNMLQISYNDRPTVEELLDNLNDNNCNSIKANT